MRTGQSVPMRPPGSRLLVIQALRAGGYSWQILDARDEIVAEGTSSTMAPASIDAESLMAEAER